MMLMMFGPLVSCSVDVVDKHVDNYVSFVVNCMKA